MLSEQQAGEEGGCGEPGCGEEMGAKGWKVWSSNRSVVTLRVSEGGQVTSGDATVQAETRAVDKARRRGLQ